MRGSDGRRLTQAEQEARRLQAARLFAAGRSVEDVMTVLEVSRSWAFGVKQKLREGGERALAAVARPEGKKKLDSGQRQALYEMVKDRSPADFGFVQALWTRQILVDLVRDIWSVEVSLPTMGKVLRELGLSPQRPVRRAYEQNPEAVARWETEDFPAIRELAHAHDAELYFGDEASVRSDYHSGTTWARVGQTPVVPTTGSRKTVSMLSAISMQGRISFDVRTGGVNSDGFIEFCQKLMGDASGRTVFLIVDNATTHVSKKTREFVRSTEGKLRLFFLPPYAPELNPDELVWKNVKHDDLGRSSIKDESDLYNRAVAALDRLRSLPDLVQGFFRAPRLAYIHAQQST
jgi:transposase